MITALTSHALLIRGHIRQFIHVQKFNPYSPQTPVFNIENKCSKIVIFVIFIICPLWRPRGISQLVSGLYYVTQDTGCNIYIGAKLYSLGRAKVFSSVATNFGLKTNYGFFFLHSLPSTIAFRLEYVFVYQF